MAGINVFTGRDLVALTVLLGHAQAGQSAEPPHDLVVRAFAIADAFVEHSDSHWADNLKADRGKRPPRPRS